MAHKLVASMLLPGAQLQVLTLTGGIPGSHSAEVGSDVSELEGIISASKVPSTQASANEVVVGSGELLPPLRQASKLLPVLSSGRRTEDGKLTD